MQSPKIDNKRNCKKNQLVIDRSPEMIGGTKSVNTNEFKILEVLISLD